MRHVLGRKVRNEPERGHCLAYDNPRDVYGADTYADNPIHDADPLPPATAGRPCEPT